MSGFENAQALADDARRAPTELTNEDSKAFLRPNVKTSLDFSGHMAIVLQLERCSTVEKMDRRTATCMG